MNVQPTNDPRLDDVLDFNEYLLKLAKAGVPIGVDALDGTEELSEKLTAINARIAMAMARGSTVRQILEADPAIPSQYRASLAVWLYCDKSPNALSALSDCASGRKRIEMVVSSAFLQPLILLGMVFLGFILILLGLSPKLESIYSQIRLKPGLGLQFLVFARQSIWLWGLAVPVSTALGLFVWSRMRSKWSFSWFPGRKKILESIWKSNYAEGCANLLEHNFSVEQTQAVLGKFRSDRNRIRRHPLLHWAFCDEVRDEDRATALHFSALACQELAQARTSLLSAWFPVVVGSLFGGAFVLGYALCLFTPIIELLTSIVNP